MPLTPRLRTPYPVRVVLSTPAVLSFVSVWKAAALAIAQLGAGLFFVAGVAAPVLGPSTLWAVLATAVLGWFARAIDIESWALLIPGGTASRVQQAFGPRAGRVAAAVAVVDRTVFAALAAVVTGQYVALVLAPRLRGTVAGAVAGQELATVIGVAIIGLLWMRSRIGLSWPRDAAARGVWVAVAVLIALAVWAAASLRHATVPAAALLQPPLPPRWTPLPVLDGVIFWWSALVLTLQAIGGGDALSRVAYDFAPPRLASLRRTRMLVGLVTASLGITTTLCYVLLVPAHEVSAWTSTPLAGLAYHLAAPGWVQGVFALALAVAAVLLLVPGIFLSMGDAEALLQRLSIEGALPGGLVELHHRLGTPVRLIDTAAAGTVFVVVLAGGRVEWLAHAFAVTIAAYLLIKIAALVRLRGSQTTAPYRVPLTFRAGRRSLPLGLIGTGVVLAGAPLSALAAGDAPAVAAATLLFVIGLVVLTAGRTVEPDAADEAPAAFDVLSDDKVSPAQLATRPGCILAPVRNPHSLDHVAAALRAAGDRDVVIMTVRLLDPDAPAPDAEHGPTPQERKLFEDAAAMAERLGHPVRPIIVVARHVVDAIASTTLQLQASEVFVGESSTLSSADQARLLGEAWERLDKPGPITARLVVAHRSGRSDTYHIGAHPPSLTPVDLDLIHRVWLDAVKAVGPHVHHHDVVRAALTQMEQQLTGPHRDEALAAIRDVSRPADELAAMLHARDYGRLRDVLRNRHAGEVAELLTALSIEDQVVVFRVLPRKDAAAVFEYLSQDAMEGLLKAMAQEDIAALLNNMAPDDRTQFLEELPATATRQLLSLLTPAERAVASTLLGYPERSVGRLMTPHYLSVREHWTVQEVLNYVRNHGQDSETLNVIYVVDDQGLLIDDIRIREFLLAPLDKRVVELMDRRFVTLTAADDQDAAVAVFRQYDRSALPVTDTVGMLIGIVTIDDVLDVAEAAATREIQRIGGSEALDEPYMETPFWRMVQKRAGWLVVLFIGEMLTATAMGVFEAEIAKAVVLTLFIPLIISSGGNSGSQASTLVIRALALGEVDLTDWWRVTRREVFAGLALGSILGAIGFMRIAAWSAFSTVYGEHWLLVGITVAFSLLGVVIWGTLSGSLLPLLLRRLGLDPATSSAPFVATLVDVTGLVIYFSVALVVLKGTLL
ncbi:MAG TPA: magnesium transporter [Vicinamibacterales bacterium]|jgi:magnesium transporter|nr:magnesium transporter [Vicinamibacterales bacterium]